MRISNKQRGGHKKLESYVFIVNVKKRIKLPITGKLKGFIYFKNRKLVNGQVNWFVKINASVDVFFFFTANVSVTDQFWLISRHFD